MLRAGDLAEYILKKEGFPQDSSKDLKIIIQGESKVFGGNDLKLHAALRVGLWMNAVHIVPDYAIILYFRAVPGDGHPAPWLT